MKIALKPALSTGLSVVGVLAAGVAAFTVNSSVLGGTTSPDSTLVATTVAAPAAPGAASAADPNSNSVAAAAQESSPAEAAATPVTDTTTTYQVGDAGSVVIDTASGAIQVVSIMPAAGWAAEPATVQGDGSVKVRFYSASQRLEFIARMAGGQVEVNVTSDPINQPAPNKPGYDDDDDEREEHEDDEREEHEDDEHEEHEEEDDD